MCGHTDGDTGVAMPSENTFKGLRQKEQFLRQGHEDTSETYGGCIWYTLLSMRKQEEEESEEETVWSLLTQSPTQEGPFVD